ncbi:MAG: YncE family protein [Phycisphaeraceae bacterium]|nr:YncE family protein [Phycisphaeraceae bacterium]
MLTSILAAGFAALTVGQIAQFDTPRSDRGDPPVATWVLAPDDPSIRIGEPGGPGSAASVDFAFTGSDPEADGHCGALITPDGSGVIIANRDSNNLTEFDIASRALVRAVPLSGSPVSLAAASDGSVIVTANLVQGTASVVMGGAEARVVTCGTYPATAMVTADGATAAVFNAGSRDITVFETATGAVLRTIPAGGVFQTLSANFETFAIGFRTYGPVLTGRTIVAPDSLDERILIIDIDTGATTVLPCDVDPMGVAITPDGTKAVVTHFNTVHKLTVVDVPGASITKVITTSDNLNGPVTINPAGTHAVIAIQNACKVVNLSTDAFSASLNTASVNELHTTFDGQYAVCVGFRGSLISYATQSVVRETNNFVSASVGAVSPVAHRAAMFSDTFGEDMLIVDTNGASGSLLSAGPTGPAPEGDKCRTGAVSADGSRAVAVSMYSANAAVIDTGSRAVLSRADVGRRGAGIAITPDGTKAVVANLDSTFATVIDVGAGTKTDVAISTRGSEVAISPDGQYAYVAVVVTDGVWRINLGTLAADGGRLATGNMGGIGFSYSQSSGITLSPDGATLVTCNSFDDTVTLIDTGSWSVIGTLAAGDFPVRAAFSPGGTRLYVTNRDSDTISVYEDGGGGFAPIASIPVGDSPFEMAVMPDGAKLYVLNVSAQNVGVVNTASLSQTSTIPISPALVGMRLSSADGRLYVSHSNASVSFGQGGYSFSQFGSIAAIDTATDSVVETFDTGRSSSAIAMAPSGSVAITPEPWGDGASIITIAGCPADIDGDGDADGDDFFAYLDLFAAGDSDADLDGDGDRDADDFFLYLDLFALGC